MPELVEKGPNIPIRLLNELEREQVVFFVGAGISVGKNSNLPSFRELIKIVYQENDIEPDSLEKSTLDWEKREQPDWNPPFLDRAFHLLEQDDRLGENRLRDTVVRVLSKKPEGCLKVHKALLDLSETSNGHRLVTTNFDNRFCQVGIKLSQIDVAPKLPIVHVDKWNSLVHLHGSISSKSHSDLVLTSADFGEAYITHGWATRFVVDLFRKFTVIFVGYSIEDPVIRYLIDAITTNHPREFNQAYVLAPFNGDHGKKDEVKIQWKSRGVNPVLFDNIDDDYSRLNGTLIEWAKRHKEPLDSRIRIVREGINKTPINKSDPIIENVLWALQNSPDAAKQFAENAKIENNENSQKRAATWLDIFFEDGFIGNPPKHDRHFEALLHDLGQSVDEQKTASIYQVSEEVEWQLIQWVLKHLHIFQVFSSVYHHYAQLPSKYIGNFKGAWIKNIKDIPNDLQYLWFVLLNDDEQLHSNLHVIVNHYDYTDIAEHYHHLIEGQLINCIAPRLVIKTHPTKEYLEFQSNLSNKDKRPIHHSDYFFKLGLEFGRTEIENIIGKEKFRIHFAELLTDHLERAIQLIRKMTEHTTGEMLEKDSFRFLTNRPSIAEHEQNKWQSKCMQFVDCVRDSYSDLVKVDEARASRLLQRWIQSGETLFKRLALHALTDNENADLQPIRQLLLEGENPGIFNKEMERETLRFLRKSGFRLTENLQIDILEAIHAKLP